MIFESLVFGIIIPGIESGKGSVKKSPYIGLAINTKPMNPKVLAVLEMAVGFEVPFRNPDENVHITTLCCTITGLKASRC